MARRRALQLDGLRRALRWEYAATRRRILQQPAALKPQRDTLRRIYERSARWPVWHHGWTVIGAGLKRVYREARKDFGTSRGDPSPENLLEWRKQVKYLWHQLQVLEPLRSGAIGALIRRTGSPTTSAIIMICPCYIPRSRTAGRTRSGSFVLHLEQRPDPDQFASGHLATDRGRMGVKRFRRRNARITMPRLCWMMTGARPIDRAAATSIA
jgi:CHAD domain